MFRRHEGHEDMDMGSMSTGTLMSMATSAATAVAAAATGAAADHSGMDMGGGHSMGGGMGMGGSCKISMLWNWNTIDACFISSSWHVKSKGGFAGTCIGVVALCMAVELVRRFQREYDRFIYAQHLKRAEAAAAVHNHPSDVSPEGTISKGGATGAAGFNSSFMGKFFATSSTPASFTPSFLQQAVRALFYMFQFAGAYFIMLLAMYYNGYVIICIFIGAYLGNFLFGSDSFQESSIKTQKTCCC